MDASTATRSTPRRDTTTPLARYQRATSGDAAYWLTADGWLRLAADLAAAGQRLSGERRIQHEDRSRDCFERAERMCRGAR